MVNIHLQMDGHWICALAIPLEDIGRLSLRPLKWLRFVAFAALGVKGHLYHSPGSNIVDYENVSLADLADNYYFNPEGDAPHLQPSSTDNPVKQGSTISSIPMA
jgi:hypothetical protein